MRPPALLAAPALLLTAATALPACGPGTPTARDVATGQSRPWILAVNSTDVWFVNQGTSASSSSYAVVRAAKSGGAPVVVESGSVVAELAADDAGACWSAQVGATGSIRCAGPAGENPREVGRANGFPTFLGTLVLDAQNVYWADGSGSVFASPRAGGGATRTVGITDTSVGWLAISTDAVWAPSQHGARRMLKDGSGYTEYSFAQQPPASLATDGVTLYANFTGSGRPDGSIVRVPLSDGQPVTLANDQELPTNLVLAGDRLYFITGNERAGVYSVLTTLTGVTPIATGFLPGGVAWDGTSVYWTEPDNGAVRAATP